MEELSDKTVTDLLLNDFKERFKLFKIVTQRLADCDFKVYFAIEQKCAFYILCVSVENGIVTVRRRSMEY